MFLKIEKISIVYLLVFLSFLSHPEKATAGNATPEQIYTLKEALRKKLVKEGICLNIDDCAPMLHEGSNKRIYLNLYGQTDQKLSSYIIDFFIQEGIKITEGIPISLRVFPKVKDEYLGLKYTFGSNDYLIKLDINK